MSKHYRIVLAALVLGLILALGVIFFIPKRIPGGKALFPSRKTPSSANTKSSDTELLRNIDDEMTAIDQEYNFNTEPAEENLKSPNFVTSTEGSEQ
jgi:hypothetical protein